MRLALCAAFCIGLAACSRSAPPPSIVVETQYIPCVEEKPRVQCPSWPDMNGRQVGEVLAEGKLAHEKCSISVETLSEVLEICLGVSE